jgi:hypothetical protein
MRIHLQLSTYLKAPFVFKTADENLEMWLEWDRVCGISRTLVAEPH